MELDVDKAALNGVTALIGAAQNGHTKTVEALLNKSATVDKVTPSGATALITAAQNGHTETVLALLKNGADVDKAALNGVTALIAAARKGYTKTVLALLDKGAIVDQTVLSATALMIAAENGHTETVLALLERGADVNKAALNGVTALIVAALMNCTKTVNAIIANTIASQRKDGVDWRIMSLGNAEANQNGQLVPRRFGYADIVLKHLSRETATLLAVVLDYEALKKAVTENFNQRNPQSHLDQNEIDKFKKLRGALEERFLEQINPSAASSSSESATNARNQAQLLAIAAVGNILTNPSQLRDFENAYLAGVINDASSSLDGASSSLSPKIGTLVFQHGKSSFLPPEVATLVFQHLIHNPRLNVLQNQIVRKALVEMNFVPPSRENPNASSAAGAAASSDSSESRKRPHENSRFSRSGDKKRIVDTKSNNDPVANQLFQMDSSSQEGVKSEDLRQSHNRKRGRGDTDTNSEDTNPEERSVFPRTKKGFSQNTIPSASSSSSSSDSATTARNQAHTGEGGSSTASPNPGLVPSALPTAIPQPPITQTPSTTLAINPNAGNAVAPLMPPSPPTNSNSRK